ncbi:hypothetical protein HID58_091844 [Brassica napus]|uniref:Uncharacterized protein n=1 Tax=Brassica napus TaxID=3708 RepID=A0ABQ7WYE7_BRANA|nr:hypothetical protein HID58_091844 [Brassica napus]
MIDWAILPTTGAVSLGSPVFKEFSTPSVLHFPYAKAPTVRLNVPVVCDVSFVSRDRMGSMLFRLRLTLGSGFCRRPPPVELRGVSQPPPSMPAWSHFGECSTDPTLRLFLLSQQVCSG